MAAAQSKTTEKVYQGGHFPRHPGSAKVRGPHAHTNVPTLKGAYTTHKKFNY